MTKYLLGILASRLMSYFYLKMSSIATKDDFRQTTLGELRKLPIAITDIENQKAIVELVDQILVAKEQNPNANTNALEIEIDKLVYPLYGLTKKKVDIVEGK